MMRVHAPGLLTTVQDLTSGRRAVRHIAGRSGGPGRAASWKHPAWESAPRRGA